MNYVFQAGGKVNAASEARRLDAAMAIDFGDLFDEARLDTVLAAQMEAADIDQAEAVGRLIRSRAQVESPARAKERQARWEISDLGSAIAAQRRSHRVTYIARVAPFLLGRVPARRIALLVLVVAVLVALALVAPDSRYSPFGIALCSVVFLLQVAWSLLTGFVDHRLQLEQAATTQLDIARSAVRDYRQTLLEAGVKQELRELVNERSTRAFGTRIAIDGFQGLSEVENPELAVDTGARTHLQRLLDSMPGGTVAISGARGAGKTTLMKQFCPPAADDRDRLALFVPVPVGYAPREFVMHLFAELCRVVLGDDRVRWLRTPDPLLAAGESARAFRSALSVQIGLLLTFAAVVAGAFGADVRLLLVGGLVAAGLFVTLASVRAEFRRRYAMRAIGENRERRPPPRADNAGFAYRWGRAQASAEEHLQELWFQQSYSTGWSGTLKPPVALELGLEHSRQLSRHQRSLPDIVRDFRSFVTSLPLDVVIGLDELDKMPSSEQAQAFLNEIKSVFGIERCFYLLSVSEDAIRSFERRGLSVRDAFDSSIDDSVHVPPLDARQTVKLLQRRVGDMSITFVLLAHCLAGGLPRDAIRFARQIVGLAGDSTISINSAARELVRVELGVKVRGALDDATALPVAPGAEGLIAWLLELQREPTAATLLVARAGRTGRDLRLALNAESPEVSRLAIESAAYCYFCGTVLEFFDGTDDEQRFENAYDDDAGTRPIDLLASARAAFSIGPEIVWQRLNDFRTSQSATIPTGIAS